MVIGPTENNGTVRIDVRRCVLGGLDFRKKLICVDGADVVIASGYRNANLCAKISCSARSIVPIK